MANTDAPPVPSTTTLRPGPMSAVTSAFQAVVAVMGSAAPCSHERCGGNLTTVSAVATASSRAAPGRFTPRIARPLRWLVLPAAHSAFGCSATRSPGATVSTPSPIATTSPAPSASGTSGKRPSL
jgi:hypothetical protein